MGLGILFSVRSLVMASMARETWTCRGPLRGHVLHRVVDRHACRDGSAGGVHVEGDVGGGVLVGQVEELRHEDVRDFVVHSFRVL